MKKILSVLLALVLVFSLTACVPLQHILQNLPESLETLPELTDPFFTDTNDPTDDETDSSADDFNRPEQTHPEITEPTQTDPKPTEPKPTEPKPTEPALDPDGSYTTKEDVALYIHLYGKLPSNFITKNQARNLGWSRGSLERYAPGKCIGGDRFGNREGLLPKASGRTYTECDIDTLGKSSRGAKRIVFSNDGLVYYTDDHYESFTLLYGEE
jgi:hypothetical protein